MDRDIDNAKRLLAMIEILEQYTDEEHERRNKKDAKNL